MQNIPFYPLIVYILLQRPFFLQNASAEAMLKMCVQSFLYLHYVILAENDIDTINISRQKKKIFKPLAV